MSAELFPLPTFKCTKEVKAAKISQILPSGETTPCDSTIILSTDDGDPKPSRAVDKQWMIRHNPQIGGYFVEYKDGYTSYSPAAPFEEGYVKVGY